MKIESIHIRNFRKLKNCHIDFDAEQTVFVGANNSGKTSAISAIVWFLKNNEKFTIKEFTATQWEEIDKIGDKWLENDTVENSWLNPHKWDDIVPMLDVWIDVDEGEQYRVNHLIPSLTTWDGKRVGVRCQYTVEDITKLYTDYKKAKGKTNALEATEEWEKAESPELFPKNLCDFLGRGDNLKTYFEVKYFVINPALEPSEEEQIQPTPDVSYDGNPLAELIKVDTILASRDFSDPEGKNDNEIDTLSKQFQQYYKSTLKEDEDISPDELDLVKDLKKANDSYDVKLSKTFEKPVKELSAINYPGFQNPVIKIRSRILLEESIKHDSAVQFALQGLEELALPEKYNGLGYRNLISMYLKLIDFRENWLAPLKEEKPIQPIHLVFVEEPEAHLHAQAQQVFVKKAFDALTNNEILKGKKGLNTQLVLSTHSNHIVNELDLNCMRYFRRVMDKNVKIPVSWVVNLSNTFGTDEETKRFVTRYIRLTHCDLFFADAVIFVEGPAEKILVPRFLKEMGLDNYYISVIEVNGRHACSFKRLIEKVGIATLVVTDIDATEKYVNEESEERYKATITKKGCEQKTGNYSIKTWITDKDSIDDLLSLDSDSKVLGNVRLAYQTPVQVKWDEDKEEQTEVCPYTFEDALVMSNLPLFRDEKLGKMGPITTIANLCKKSTGALKLQEMIFEKLEKKSGFQKADFANSLLYSDKFDNLEAPAYISEGIKWLKSYLDSNGEGDGE